MRQPVAGPDQIRWCAVLTFSSLFTKRPTLYIFYLIAILHPSQHSLHLVQLSHLEQWLSLFQLEFCRLELLHHRVLFLERIQQVNQIWIVMHRMWRQTWFEGWDLLDDLFERLLVDLHVLDGVQKRDLVLAKTLDDLLKKKLLVKENRQNSFQYNDLVCCNLRLQCNTVTIWILNTWII